MSGQKGEFPPRVFVRHPLCPELGHKPGIDYEKKKSNAEYLSLSEHAALIEQARRRARGEAFREVAAQMRRESGFQHAQKRADYYEAKASEGEGE